MRYNELKSAVSDRIRLNIHPEGGSIMKRTKKSLFVRLFALVLAVVLVLSGCTGGEKKSDEVEKLKFEMFAWGETPDEEMVEEALNAITREKIGVEVDIEFHNVANYSEQIGLKMAGDEEMDLLAIIGDTPNMVRQGELMPIDDLLDQYGKDIKEICGEFLYYGTIDGKNYGVPVMNNKKYIGSLNCRKDIIDELGIDPASMMTLDGITAAFEKVYAAYPEMTMIAPDSEGIFYGYYGIDSEHVQHLDYIIGYYLAIMNETEYYRRELEYVRDWYLKGYVDKDAAASSEVGSLAYYDGNLFSYINMQNVYSDKVEPVVHLGLTAITYPTYSIPISKDVVSSVDTLGVGISSNSKHPEAAMKWINLLFTDQEMATTLGFGVKGHHWDLNEKGLAEYCEGIEPGNSGWETGFNWSMGNTGASYVFATVSDDPDYNKKQIEMNDTAERSIAYGFCFDGYEVEAEMAACESVIEKYALALESGSVDIDSVLPQFLDELKAAGIDKVVAEAQKQLDEFIAAKK